jgi:hypothetical protein
MRQWRSFIEASTPDRASRDIMSTCRRTSKRRQPSAGWLRLHEKGDKRHEMPCHQRRDEYLDAWIARASIGNDKKGHCFRSFKRVDDLTGTPITRSGMLYMFQAEGQRPRPALFTLLPQLSGDRHCRLPAKPRHAGTRAALRHINHRVPRNSMTGRRTRFRSDEVERSKF